MIAQKKVKQEAECENVRTRKTINSCVTFKIGSSSRSFGAPALASNRRSSLSAQTANIVDSHESFQSDACINLG